MQALNKKGRTSIKKHQNLYIIRTLQTVNILDRLVNTVEEESLFQDSLKESDSHPDCGTDGSRQRGTKIFICRPIAFTSFSLHMGSFKGISKPFFRGISFAGLGVYGPVPQDGKIQDTVLLSTRDDDGGELNHRKRKQ